MKNISLLILVSSAFIALINAGIAPNSTAPEFIDPIILRPFMFTQTITGDADILVPYIQQKNQKG